MTSSYLKAMQLTKQLEEKAKEEKKNRQLADEEMLVVEEALDSAKAVDIDTVKAEEFLVKAQNSIEGKEYKDALSYATQASEAVKKEFSISIKSILDSAEGLLNLSKDIGADFSEGEALLSQAQSSLSEEKYDKALEQAKLSWVAFEKVALEHLSESFSKTQSMIMLARESGDDVAASEDLLKQARESMESQEYSVAYHRLKDCMESVGTGISSQVEELLDEAKGYQITAKELGADIDKIVEYVNRTEEEIESGKLEAAMSSARLSKSEAEKTLSRAISDNIELFNMSLVEAERIEADLTKSRELLDLVKTSLKNSNYIEAIDALNECESELHNTQFQRVLSTISQSRSKFVIANKIGADISEAMEYLNKAKESLKEGDFLNALEMAESGDDVVNGIIKEYEDIENTLSTLEEQVKRAKEMGADMSVVENSLLSAKEYLEQKEFDGVRESVGKTEDELNSALYAYATECIEIAELVISAGDKLGANLNEPELMMKDAITETKAGNFREAIELAASSTTRSEEIIKIHVSNTIASAELAIYDAENVDVDEVKGLIESAKVEFERNAFDRAFEYADKALNMLETGQSAKAREKVTELTKGLTIAKRMGCDIGSIDDVARKCNEYLNTRDFTSALVDAEKAYNDVKNLQYVAAERMFGEAKLSAIEAKKLGIDITDMREALKRAKLAFSKEDFEKTFKESQSAKMAAERQVNLHQKAYNSISQAAAMLAEAKKNQAEVKDAMAILVAARGLFEHFDYENALKEAEKAKEETEKLMNLFSAAGILNDSQEHVALLKGLEVDVSELEKHVEELTVLIKTKDAEKALTLAEELEAMTLHALEPAVNNLISSTTSVIMDAKEVGIAVTAQEDKLEQAMSHLESLSFKEAVEDAIAVRDGVNKIKEMSQRAAVEIKNAQVKLGEGEPLHADMSKSKELLNSALNELKTANYEIAIKLAMDSVNESRKSIEKHVSETIKAFKVSIEKAKMEGMTVVAAEKLMDKAVGAFNNKDYKGSLSLAMKSEGELEKVGLQQEMAERAISTAENKLKETEGMGIHSKKASNILQQAREELRKGEYVRALEHAIQSGDELHNVSEEFQDANDTLGNLKAHIGMATNISADVSIAKKLLLDAESAMRDHDYRTATEIAKEGAIESRRLSHTALSTKISAAYKLIDLAAKSDLDVQGTSPMLAEAKTFMDTAKFEVSNEKIEYVMTDIKDKLNTHVNDMISQSERSMAHAKEVGAEITESEQLLSKAKTLLDQGRFRDALNLAEKSREAIDLKKGFER
ncbi:MAG: hypothetical protein KAX31_02220, partial [Thermoplasmata archaeon]|nr:hypothetical protein [Thermoplasmata archaeon]